MFSSQIYTKRQYRRRVRFDVTFVFSHYNFKLFSFSNLIAERKIWGGGSDMLRLEDTICTEKYVRYVS